MVDETTDDDSTNRNLNDASVLATAGPDNDPKAFLIEFPDGTIDHVPGTARNQIIFGEGKFAEIDGIHVFEDDDVTVVADPIENDYRISRNGAAVQVPSDYVDDVVYELSRSDQPGIGLAEIYDEITEGQVRRDVVSAFIGRFPNDRIEITADGWEIDDTFLVTYEGENFLLDVDATDPYGSSVGDKQAVYLDLDSDGERMLSAPDGETYSVSETEQQFIATVEGLLFPEDYFGVELVDEIEQHKAESLADDVESITEQAKVTGFTDSKTGIHHGSKNHSFRKHDVDDLNVTDDVRDMLWSNPYDHAAVHELLLRKQEFQNNPDVDVFADEADDAGWKWDEIEQTSENAPIPPEVRQKLDDMFQS